MRLAALSLSAVLLSGCSWLGGNTPSDKSYNYGNSAYGGGPAAQHMGPQSRQAGHQVGGAHNPCVVYSPVQPVPNGCDPSKVTLAGGQGHNGGQGTYATGGYGSHAYSAGAGQNHPSAKSKLKKPKLRGSLSFGVDKNIGGTLADYAVPLVGDTVVYNPGLYNEGVIRPNTATGGETFTGYTSDIERIHTPSLSFGDVHRAPTRIAAGLEYIATPHFTVFANAGFTNAPGVERGPVTVQATLIQTRAEYDDMGVLISGPQNSGIPNVDVAHLYYDYNDQQKYDLEAGARYYFKPLIKNQGHKTLTPFVGASAGMSHVNAIEFKKDQDQLFLDDYWSDPTSPKYYDVVLPEVTTRLYDADWLVNGSLTAGMEWQVTPKAAIALESGVKYMQARDYVTGESGDATIDIPLTLRGSFNF